MVNTDFGRDLLCIPKEYPRIFRIEKNCVHSLVEDNGVLATCIADFRVGAKWGNVIRYRWKQFNSYARYFQYGQDYSLPMSRMTREALAMSCDTLTAYPTPGAASGNDAALEYWENNAWSNGYDASAASRSSDPTNNGLWDSAVQSQAAYLWSSGNWQFYRGVWFISTSALGSGATVSAAKFTLTGTRVTNAYDVRLHKHLSTNTQVARADYNRTLFGDAVASDISNHTWGTTDTAVDITITDLSVISKTSYTRLGTRLKPDVDNSPPASSGGLQVYFSDQTGTTSDPKLYLVYTTASLKDIIGMGVIPFAR